MSQILTSQEQVNNVFKVIDNVTIVKFLDNTLTKIKVADNITTGVTQATTQIATLNTQVNQLNDDMITAKQNIATLQNDTQQLIQENNDNKVQIEINKQNIQTNTNSINNIQTVNETQNLRLNALEQTSSHFENDISTLSSRVDSNSVQIGFQSTYINQLNVTTQSLQSQITNVQNDFNSDHIILANQQVKVNNLEVKDSQQQVTNTNLQNQITTLESSNVNWNRLTNLPNSLLIAMANNFEYLVFNPAQNIIFNSRYKIDWANVLNKPSGGGGSGITWEEAIAYFLAINPENPVVLNSNYSLSSSQVSDLNSVVNGLITAAALMPIDPGTTTNINSNYRIDYSQVLNAMDPVLYLLVSPPLVQNLSTNYRLEYSSLLNAPNLSQYMLNVPSVVLTIDANYRLPFAQVTGVPSYLLTSPPAVTTFNANYRIPYAQVTGTPSLSSYMPIDPGSITTINNNYRFSYNNITNWPISLVSVFRIYTNENGNSMPTIKTLNQFITNAVVDSSTSASQNISAELFRWNQIAMMKATQYADGMYYQAVTTPNAMQNVTQYTTSILAKPLVPGLSGNPYQNVQPQVVAVGATISDSNIVNNSNITTLQYGVNVQNNQAMWNARTGVLVRESTYQNGGSGGNMRETMVYLGTMYNTLSTFSQTTTSYPNSFINGQNFNNNDSCKTGLANSAVPTYQATGGRYMGCDSAVCTPWSGIHIKTSDGETSGYLADGSRLWAYTPADSMAMSWSDEDTDMDQTGLIAYITPQGDYVKVSSMKLKENVRPKSNNLKVLNKVSNLDVFTYTYKKEMGQHKKDFKYLSQEEQDQLSQEEKEKYDEKQRLYEAAVKRINKKRNRLNIGFSRENIIEQRLHYAIDGNPINKGNKIVDDGIQEDGIGVEMTSLIPYLVMCVKGLKELNEEKDNKIKSLEQRVSKLEGLFNQFNSLFTSQ